MNSNPNFLNNLAAKLAAGPSKPVGHGRRTPLSTQETEKRAEEATPAQQKPTNVGSNPNFLNNLALKLAAGPPKKPLGLVKQTPVDTRETEKRAEEAASAQHKLASIMKQSQDKKKE